MTIEKTFNSSTNDGSSNNCVMMSHVGCRWQFSLCTPRAHTPGQRYQLLSRLKSLQTTAAQSLLHRLFVGSPAEFHLPPRGPKWLNSESEMQMAVFFEVRASMECESARRERQRERNTGEHTRVGLWKKKLNLKKIIPICMFPAIPVPAYSGAVRTMWVFVFSRVSQLWRHKFTPAGLRIYMFVAFSRAHFV